MYKLAEFLAKFSKRKTTKQSQLEQKEDRFGVLADNLLPVRGLIDSTFH